MLQQHSNSTLLEIDGRCKTNQNLCIHSFCCTVAHRWLAATCETLTLHIDMSGPKVTPFPADVLGRIETMFAMHKSLPQPEQAGRSIAIRRRKR